MLLYRLIASAMWPSSKKFDLLNDNHKFRCCVRVVIPNRTSTSFINNSSNTFARYNQWASKARKHLWVVFNGKSTIYLYMCMVHSRSQNLNLSVKLGRCLVHSHRGLGSELHHVDGGIDQFWVMYLQAMNLSIPMWTRGITCWING